MKTISGERDLGVFANYTEDCVGGFDLHILCTLKAVYMATRHDYVRNVTTVYMPSTRMTTSAVSRVEIFSDTSRRVHFVPATVDDLSTFLSNISSDF